MGRHDENWRSKDQNSMDQKFQALAYRTFRGEDGRGTKCGNWNAKRELRRSLRVRIVLVR